MSGQSVNNLRLGFVGHGVHACANLYPSIRQAGAKIHRVATRSMQNAREAATDTGAVHAHDSVTSMLGHGDLDAVFISVAPEDHAELTLQCLQAGVHVFVEKPLGMTVSDAAAVAKAATMADLIVMVGFMKRYAPVYQQLFKLVTDHKKFGRIMAIDGMFGFTPWSDDLRDDTFLKLGAIHLVDLYRSLLGEVTSVQGVSNSRGAEISSSYTFKFVDGPIGSLSLYGSQAWGREQERITITGTRGWAEVTNLTVLEYHETEAIGGNSWQALDERTTVLTSVNSPMSGGLRDLYHRGFVGEVTHFLEAVASGTAVNSSASDNVATMTLCDEMLDAIAS